MDLTRRELTFASLASSVGQLGKFPTFAELSVGTTIVPKQTKTLRVDDRYGAMYIFDSAVDWDFTAKHPKWSFLTKTENGELRGFRLETNVVDGRMFGYTGSGNVDEAGTLNAISSYLTQTGVSDVYLHGICALSSTVFWPAHAVVKGSHGKGLIVRPFGVKPHLTDNFLFMFNTVDGKRWITKHPISPGGCRNVHFSNPSGLSKIAGVLFFGGCSFIDCSAYLVAPAIKRPAQPSIGATGEYSDHVKIEHLQADNPGLGEFAIDIDGSGDGLSITRCGFGFSTNGIMIRSGSNTGVWGGVLDTVIGGNHYIRGGYGVSIRAMHLERGKITIEGSTVTISSSWFAPDSETDAPPVLLKDSSRQSTVCILDGVEFFWGFNHFAVVPFDVAVGANTSLTVRQCARVVSYVGSESSRQGIRLSAPTKQSSSFALWNNSSHLLSRSGSVEHGPEVLFDHIFSVPASWNALSGLSTVTPNNLSRIWSEESTTHYYRLQLVVSGSAEAGVLDSQGERSIEVSRARNEIVRIDLTDFAVPAEGCNVRIYRGTRSGEYNVSCCLPLLSGCKTIYDDGRTISSLPWIGRNVSGADKVRPLPNGLYRQVGEEVIVQVSNRS